MKKRSRIILAVVLALIGTAGGYVGNMFGLFSQGNYGEYALHNTQKIADSPIAGKSILFLGSSVTYGYAGTGVSFVDYLAAAYGITAVKEAVSGTTLADLKSNSYVARLRTVDTKTQFDAFVCQLSTNDASKKVPLGTVSASTELRDFDTQTVAGAIEYIIAYVKQTWDCPVLFYTQAKYDSDAYADMVELLYKIKDKWDIRILDLWNDEQFNDITDEERKLYLVDAIHPTKAGYKQWWLPLFREELYKIVK